MLKLNISKSVEDFRESFRAWLESHKPDLKTDPKLSALDNFIAQGRRWQKRLSEDSWIGVHWPKEYGGRSLSLVEEAVLQEELAKINAPQIIGLFGLTMVGPVLIKHGTEEQKKRFLPSILSAKEIWCQGFSEPGAGSDLAAIKTRAVVSDQGFLLSGQKVWTSFAQIADFCFVLCRTSDESERHEGLSYLLVDMRAAGITKRPLKQISGDEEFNEVFFDNVVVPKENVVGQIGEGWKIAISTLMYERVVLTFARQLQSESALRDLLSKFKDSKDERLVFELTRELVKSSAVRSLAYEHLIAYSKGKSPGPEGSMDKLLWSESFQSISKLALKFLAEKACVNEGDSAEDIHRYLYSRGRTIAAGSSEIQKNIIAERVLGLPRLKFTGN